MTRRRCLRVTLSLGLLLVGGAVLTLFRWPLVGWLRGEAAFQGMPTSYWSAQIAALEPILGDDPVGTNIPALQHRFELTLWERARKALGLAPAQGRYPWDPILVGEGSCLAPPIPDPSANPVLRELAHDDNALVRWAALNRLKIQIGKYAEDEAISASLIDLFHAALADPDPTVRREAASALASANPTDPERIAAILRTGLKLESVPARRQSILGLVELGARSRSAVPDLPELVQTCEEMNIGTWSVVVAARQQLAAEAGDGTK